MGRVKNRRAGGIRRRWLLNSLSVVVLVLMVSLAAFVVAVMQYYYANVRSSLEAKARTTTDFFGSYISQSYSEYYLNVYQYAQKFEEKDRLELQFINATFTVISG